MQRPTELARIGGQPLLCDRSLSTTSGVVAWPERAPNSGGAARGGKGAFQGKGWPIGELDLSSTPGGPASSAPTSSALASSAPASSLLEAPPPLLRPTLLEGPPLLLEAPPPLLKAAAGRRGREPSSSVSSDMRPALVRALSRP
jgi:hypothetical protein